MQIESKKLSSGQNKAPRKGALPGDYIQI